MKSVRNSTGARRQRGFTLIEMMIVVTVMGILALIAFPSYTSYMVRANRSAAQQFMLDLAGLEQAFLTDARAYTATVGAGGLNVALPSDVSEFYTVAIVVGATPPTFTITATPIAGKRQAADGALTLNHAGVKTPADKW